MSEEFNSDSSVYSLVHPSKSENNQQIDVKPLSKKDKKFEIEMIAKTDFPNIIYKNPVTINTEIKKRIDGTEYEEVSQVHHPIYISGEPIKRFKYKTVEDIELASKKYCSSIKNIRGYPNLTEGRNNFRTIFGMILLYTVLILTAFIILVYYNATYFILTVVGPIGFVFLLMIAIYIIVRRNKEFVCENDVRDKLLKYKDKILNEHDYIIF